MLRVTWYLGESGTAPAGKVLCDSSRSYAEIDLAWNHQRATDIAQIATVLGASAAAYGRDFANWRNTLALTCRREKNLSGTAFADYEAALVFALEHPADFAGAGTLKLEMVGTTTNQTRYLLNVVLQDLQLVDPLGIAPAFRYTFNGGLISSSSPFS